MTKDLFFFLDINEEKTLMATNDQFEIFDK